MSLLLSQQGGPSSYTYVGSIAAQSTVIAPLKEVHVAPALVDASSSVAGTTKSVHAYAGRIAVQSTAVATTTFVGTRRYTGAIAAHSIVQAPTSQPYIRHRLYLHQRFAAWAAGTGDFDPGDGIPLVYGSIRPEPTTTTTTELSPTQPLLDEPIELHTAFQATYAYVSAPDALVPLGGSIADPWTGGTWLFRYRATITASSTPSDELIRIRLYRHNEDGTLDELGGDTGWMSLIGGETQIVPIETTWTTSGYFRSYLAVYISFDIFSDIPSELILYSDDGPGALTALDVPMPLVARTYFGQLGTPGITDGIDGWAVGDAYPMVEITAAVSKTKVVTGAIAAQSTVAATIKETQVASAAIAGQSGVAAAVTKIKAVTGAIAAQSAAAAIVTITKVVVGAIAGQSSVAASVSETQVDSTAVTGQSGVAATTTFIPGAFSYSYTGVVAAQSAVVGTTALFQPGAYIYSGTIAAQFDLTAALARVHAPTTTIPAQSTIAAPVSDTRSYTGAVDTQSVVTAPTSYERGGIYRLTATVGLIPITGFDAGLTYTPLVLPSAQEGGGGMGWPVPQRVRRERIRPPRVPVLVHRTIMATPGVVAVAGATAGLRYRARLAGQPVTVGVTAAPVTVTYTRAVVHAQTAVPAPLPVTATYRRALVAHAGAIAARGSVTTAYRAALGAQSGAVAVRGAVMTGTITKHPRYVTMFEDDEWLLLEAA